MSEIQITIILAIVMWLLGFMAGYSMKRRFTSERTLMGMFDWVNFTMPCPECGKQVEGFQTKDYECYMATVEPDTVSNLYSGCDCGCWIELSRNASRTKPPLRVVPLTRAELEEIGFVVEVRDGGKRIWKKKQDTEEAEKRKFAAGSRSSQEGK